MNNIKNNMDNYLSELFNPILVHDFLSLSAKRFPNKEALIFGNRRLKYREVDHQSDLLADFLIKIDIDRHDRIIIFADNTLETIISIYGILKAGAIFILLNGSLKTPKLQYIIKDSGAKMLIGQSSKKDTVNAALKSLNLKIPVIFFGDEKLVKDKNPYYKWEEIINGLPSDTLSIFYFEADSINTLSWDKIRTKYIILRRDDLSLRDLELINWTLTFD